MKITKSVAAGAGVGLLGQGLALGATMAAAIAAGGGPDADLEPGGKGFVLIVAVLVYAVAQLVVLGGCVALAIRLGRGPAAGIVAGSVIGLAASLFYLCGGAAS